MALSQLVAAVFSHRQMGATGTTFLAAGVCRMRAVAAEARATWDWTWDRAKLHGFAGWIGTFISLARLCGATSCATHARMTKRSPLIRSSIWVCNICFFIQFLNNHVLHTLLVRLSVALFGGSPVAIRLPAFVAGVLVVPLTFTSIAAACSQCLQRFYRGWNLRNISLPRFVRHDGQRLQPIGPAQSVPGDPRISAYGAPVVERLCVVLANCRGLGLFDMPSFLFPAAGVCLWCFAMLLSRGFKARWILIRGGIPFALVTAGLTGVFYTPVVIVSNGIQTIIANKFVENLAWSEFVRAVPMHLCIRSVNSLVMFLSSFCSQLGAVRALAASSWRRKSCGCR